MVSSGEVLHPSCTADIQRTHWPAHIHASNSPLRVSRGFRKDVSTFQPSWPGVFTWTFEFDLGTELQALPYVVAGKELRSALLQRLPLRADEDVFHDVTVWLDRFQVDVTQAGYFSQSREEIPERKRKYLEGRSRTTRETLEAENRRTFPMKSKSLDIPAFRFKPIQVGV